MIRKEAVEIIGNYIGKNPIISANGFMSRDLFEVNDKESNFYMIGSMGLASSIGLGIALKNPKKQVFVFDGDGSILMNLGSLTTIGSIKPKNLIHVIFDNSSHESTGGQPTNSNKISIDGIGKVTNYRVFKASNNTELEKILKKLKNISGPVMIVIKIKKNKKSSKRVSLDTVFLKNRFMEYMAGKP